MPSRAILKEMRGCASQKHSAALCKRHSGKEKRMRCDTAATAAADGIANRGGGTRSAWKQLQYIKIHYAKRHLCNWRLVVCEKLRRRRRIVRCSPPPRVAGRPLLQIPSANFSNSALVPSPLFYIFIIDLPQWPVWQISWPLVNDADNKPSAWVLVTSHQLNDAWLFLMRKSSTLVNQFQAPKAQRIICHLQLET